MTNDDINNTEDFGLDADMDGKKPGETPVEVTRISGMYQDWFLDYASYVILERAVPHLNDGLKPVHRRILHAMKRMDDGRFNKVANIIGHTMQFHPHGDASIGDALVQLGQKDLLVETQGNWGNILTGDSSAAPRYIEARLSKFANDVVFNPKTTKWRLSYDGRNKEPITLPVKFPLLLAQGVEGIAVGLASKILPHNFNELIEASISYLKKQDFEIYPDFPTGGMMDASRYNDGLRGGAIKVRARIEKTDRKTLTIRELPYGKTTGTLIDSIIKANDRGKIKIKKIDDNTAEFVEIQLHLGTGISSDQTIDALYAFTDCESSISPNCCVIEQEKPRFMGVKAMLKNSTDNTLNLLKLELEIKLDELMEQWHMVSLEKIFIEKEVYEDIKVCKTEEEILTAIDKGLKPHVRNLFRKVTRDDCIKLSNIPIKRISKFSSFKADELIKSLENEMEEVKHHLENIIDYTIAYYKEIKRKYGKGRERLTEFRSFENIEATKVVMANEKLFVNRKEGFIGTGLKKDEYVCDCSDIDDIIAIKKDGSYIITKVSEKSFVGKDILHADVFKKNDDRTIYNIVYRDGWNGNIYMKRCAVKAITRDREYTFTKGTEGSQILYLSVNPNGEAEVIKIYLKPRARLKKTIFEEDFSELAIKGRSSQGNILTKYAIHKIVLKEKGESTLGGRELWFDAEVRRLNDDNKGQYLGEFFSGDRLLGITKSGNYRIYNTDLTTHFEDDIFFLEKFDENKIFSVVYFDADVSYFYLKRCNLEHSESLQSFIGENGDSKLILISDKKYPQIKIIFGGKHKDREDEFIDVEEFIAVKSYRAKGKRLTTFDVNKVLELEPLQKDPPDIEAKEEGKSDESEKNSGGSQMELDF